MSQTIIIIGAGQAGAEAATSLRQADFQGEIILIGDEPMLPYQRPPLSKAYLKGEMKAERLLLRPEEFWAKQNVELKTGCKVSTVNTAQKTIKLDSGDELSYETLLLATGASARSIASWPMDAETIFTLRSIADTDILHGRFSKGDRLIVIGAGYIGLEVAAALRSVGVDVTIIEAQSRVLQRVVSEDMSAFFFNLHKEHGVKFHLQAAIESVSAGETGVSVSLMDGQKIDANGLLLAVGSSPNIGLAKSANLAVSDAILVNGACRTTDPSIFAAGDCTRFHSDLYNRPIRLESVQNAIDQAKAAALAIMGKPVLYNPVPWFWSDQYEIKLQIAGLNDGFDRTEISGDPLEPKFAVSYFQGEKLLAVDAVNSPRDHMLARRAISAGLAES